LQELLVLCGAEDLEQDVKHSGSVEDPSS